MTIVTVYALQIKNEIKESHIILWNDLRSEYLHFEVKLNDSIILKSPKARNENSSLSLKLKPGTYTIKTIINSKAETKKFTISANHEKYIYISFNDKGSEYGKYFYTYTNHLLKQKTASKKYTRAQLKSIKTEIRKNVTIENLKSLGYNPGTETLQINILDQPYAIN